MSRTTTKIIKFQSLSDRNDTAPIVVKLMMACNDLQRANEALTHFKNARSSHRAGFCMYFVRLQLGHLFEGFKILKEIQEHGESIKLVRRCDNQTRKSFDFLQQYFSGGSKRPDFEKLVGKIRHNVTFHYDQSDALIERAIKARASGIGSKTSSLTRGSTAYRWNFKVADDLIDSIVCRQIWKIPPEKNLQEEADKIAQEVFEIFLNFMDFSGEFVWRYFE